ncbi:two-component system response regulator CreB [Serratia plymuthica]|jgi:two-component system catabolic regulation response regulator CreB|uniref:Two-component system response regulator CreB n=2 Tax=Serratia plymuthica TaxID=82996 RepID=A0A318NV10_SERPL|nr:two-component system response regulator CreB [Serratia plymuthica]AGO56803.1 transcriptional regulatory protein CreB [Serratia plymuthica 4Rx13]AGP45851.1 transcriptional regulator [Serratia plymuthica S13]ANJ94340.1 transcriptional regulator [Serratia plymuthica]ANK00204.1 transcriptional regulator [Serratia plymuthica]EKF62710.1 response regulator [Serratia plymuthica A30]
MKPTLWLVEDEPSIADTLIYTLESEGFQVRWFERGEPALQALAQGAPALVILDVGLPDINGFELCRRLLSQSADLPILFLTARSDEVDRLIGLEIGADDYVAKPFSPREVSARVRTILRRLQKQQRLQQPALYTFGPFDLDEPGAILYYHQQPLPLTRYEFLLLKTLLLAPGRVFSRQQLMDSVWAQAEESLDRTVDTHIKTLRAKLRAIDPGEPPIHTHRGMGYSVSRLA